MLVVSVNGLLDHKTCKRCFWQQIIETRLEKPTMCSWAIHTLGAWCWMSGPCIVPAFLLRERVRESRYTYAWVDFLALEVELGNLNRKPLEVQLSNAPRQEIQESTSDTLEGSLLPKLPMVGTTRLPLTTSCFYCPFFNNDQSTSK